MHYNIFIQLCLAYDNYNLRSEIFSEELIIYNLFVDM